MKFHVHQHRVFNGGIRTAARVSPVSNKVVNMAGIIVYIIINNFSLPSRVIMNFSLPIIPLRPLRRAVWAQPKHIHRYTGGWPLWFEIVRDVHYSVAPASKEYRLAVNMSTVTDSQNFIFPLLASNTIAWLQVSLVKTVMGFNGIEAKEIVHIDITLNFLNRPRLNIVATHYIYRTNPCIKKGNR